MDTKHHIDPIHSVKWRLRLVRKIAGRYKEDRQQRRFFRPFVGRRDLVFDIGGNIGARAKQFDKLGARVVTLEPVSATYGKLVENTRGCRRVTALRLGASDKRGTATINLCSSDPSSSMEPEFMEGLGGLYEGVTWYDREEIPITTLDALIEEYGEPSFVKIDVEGHEVPVLKGLSHPVDALSFEYSPFRIGPAFECLDILEGLGHYRYNYSKLETFRLALPEFVDAVTFRPILAALGDGSREAGDVYAVRMGAP